MTVAAAARVECRRGLRRGPVLRERGQREVFCGLTGIIWLHRKIQDAFFLVVGSRTCAHLIQSAAGVMIFAEPRFATAIIEERDLAGLADVNEELDRVVSRSSSVGPTSACCSWSAPARRKSSSSICAGRRNGCRAASSPQVRILNYSGSGIETTFTAGRGRLPRLAGAGAARAAAGAPRRRCWWSARWPMSSRTSSSGCSPQLGVSPVHFLPPRRAADLPRGRAEHALHPRPAVPGRYRPRARTSAARSVVRGTVSARRRRHDRTGCRPIADEWSVDAARFEAATAISRERARRRAWRATGDELAGKRVFFFPDSQLEVPLARFLSRELGMHLVEVGTPYLHRQHLAQELDAAAGRDVLISEGQHVENQLDRCRAARPDLVVCGLGLANPLEAEGITTKWSIELVFTPIQGYEQAGDLAELFARPLVRRARLGA